MHQVRTCYSFNVEYVERYFHMICLWQAVFRILACTTFSKRRFPTQNHIKSTSWCSLVLETLEAQMRVAVVKSPINAIDFEQEWIKWCAMRGCFL